MVKTYRLYLACDAQVFVHFSLSNPPSALGTSTAAYQQVMWTPCSKSLVTKNGWKILSGFQWGKGNVQRCFLNLGSICFFFFFSQLVSSQLTPSVWDLLGQMC